MLDSLRCRLSSLIVLLVFWSSRWSWHWGLRGGGWGATQRRGACKWTREPSSRWLRCSALGVHKKKAATMKLRCDRSHEHCRLEGQFPGISRTRASYMEDYQPCLAADLTAALSAPEDPQDDAFAVEEVKAIQGRLVQLITSSGAEAVMTVQRLHRNLDHHSPENLTEMLESKGLRLFFRLPNSFSLSSLCPIP